MNKPFSNLRYLSVLAAMSFTLNIAYATAPAIQQGIQFGDVSNGHAIVWSRSDQASRMMIEYAYNSEFNDSIKATGPYATAESDFTAKQDLTGLFAGKDVYVKVWFEDLTNARNAGEAVNCVRTIWIDSNYIRRHRSGNIASRWIQQ